MNAPYVEVVEKLQANPYFYFLGDIIRERLHTGIDTTGALIRALDRQYARELHPQPVTPLDTLISPGETFPDLDVHFSTAAQQNTVDELGRLKDSSAVDLLVRLTSHVKSTDETACGRCIGRIRGSVNCIGNEAGCRGGR